MRLGTAMTLSLARTHMLTSRYVVPGGVVDEPPGLDGHKLLHNKPIEVLEASCMLVDGNISE